MRSFIYPFCPSLFVRRMARKSRTARQAGLKLFVEQVETRKNFNAWRQMGLLTLETSQTLTEGERARMLSALLEVKDPYANFALLKRKIKMSSAVRIQCVTDLDQRLVFGHALLEKANEAMDTDFSTLSQMQDYIARMPTVDQDKFGLLPLQIGAYAKLSRWLQRNFSKNDSGQLTPGEAAIIKQTLDTNTYQVSTT